MQGPFSRLVRTAMAIGTPNLPPKNTRDKERKKTSTLSRAAHAFALSAEQPGQPRVPDARGQPGRDRLGRGGGFDQDQVAVSLRARSALETDTRRRGGEWCTSSWLDFGVDRSGAPHLPKQTKAHTLRGYTFTSLVQVKSSLVEFLATVAHHDAQDYHPS